MTRLIILILFIPSFAYATSSAIENYVPPPMFDESSNLDDYESSYPPLPPRRPTKINVPQSYIDYLRKHGKPPQLIKKSRPKSGPAFNSNILIEPTAQDILDQINPQ